MHLCLSTRLVWPLSAFSAGLMAFTLSACVERSALEPEEMAASSAAGAQAEGLHSSGTRSEGPLSGASSVARGWEARYEAPTEAESLISSTLRLNQLQMKGTHNSYHIEMPGPKYPDYYYTHLPLDQQLEEQGVRQFELDLHYNGLSDEMLVYHAIVIDMRSTCRYFTDCLKTMKAWSDANPMHHPITLLLEPKEWSSPRPAETFLKRVEDDILSVIPKERLVTPALVQGAYPDLASAVEAGAWPLLDDVRGRFMFILHTDGELELAYTHNDLDLKDRIMFVDTPPGKSYSAVTVLNDPIGQYNEIRSVVSRGYMVRTRADSCCGDTDEQYTEQLNAALSSGAHMISGDFPAPDEGMTYYTHIPGGTPSRCNPVTAPSGCTSEAIESLP